MDREQREQQCMSFTGFQGMAVECIMLTKGKDANISCGGCVSLPIITRHIHVFWIFLAMNVGINEGYKQFIHMKKSRNIIETSVLPSLFDPKTSILFFLF